MTIRTKRALMAQRLATLALALLPLGAFAVEPGQPAPEFALPAGGKTVRLVDYRGKLVYLDFWASWCGPCRQSFPWMNEMQQKYGAQGLQVIAVNVDKKAEDANRFLADNVAKFAIAFDPVGATPKAYAVKAMPSSMLIAPDGSVQFVHAGFREEERRLLEDKIRAALPTRKSASAVDVGESK